MKKLQIGNIQTNIVSGAEINILRWNMFQNWYLQISENIDNVSINQFLKDIELPLANSNFYEINRLIDNLQQGILLKEVNKESAWNICFALICSEPDEELHNVDEDFLKDKIKRFAKEGLTFDTVKNEIINFIMPLVQK